jgi:peptide/nickel transport system substrate-binding protein
MPSTSRRLFVYLWVSVLPFAGPIAADTVIPADSWPASWFEAPHLASHFGITEFSESPTLSERVARGEIPPLGERLPDDPYVIEPAERVGDYGGTIRVFHRDADLLTGLANPLTMDPAVSGVLPNLVTGWEYTDEGRVLTLHLRPGLRWSDGAPYSAYDWTFHHQRFRLNKELTPVIIPRWLGASVTAPDSLTVVFSFLDPHPFFVNELSHGGAGYALPAHFMRDYHPDFVDRQEVIDRAIRAGYLNWMLYFADVRSERLADPSGRPTMDAYFLVRKSPTLLMYERNPFYPKIDPAGNQLPYADRIMSLVVMNPEVVTAKTSTGQVDFSALALNTQDIPLFKRGEKAGGFTTRIWNRLHGVDVVIQPNLTVEDPVLRKMCPSGLTHSKAIES